MCYILIIRYSYEFAEPRIHAMVYEPTAGQLTKLPVDFKEYLSELRSVYDLYRLDDSSSTK
jgi:hypothetical protein